MWPSLISKAKQGGLDAIATYVFWNLHEPEPGKYDFSGRYDIVRFIKEVQAQGLYVFLRIGPFIEAEWSYGGLPFWLHDVPDIVFRSDNEPFKFYMQNFTTKIVTMMKSEKLYASQGGPIILSQIENEYQNIEKGFHDKGPPYVRWAAAMAVGLDTGVPWVMCKQDDAPDPVINSCNGMRCGETFVGPNSSNKPALWTENWTHFYDIYGNITKIRSAQDLAYHAALFIYHGGTNFGRTSASFIITSYYDQAPLDEYGLIRQPKWGHLKELHAAIKLCSQTLLYGAQTNISLGELQEVSTQFNTRTRQPAVKMDSADRWEEYSEVIPVFDETSLRSDLLLEQMNTTKDASDYLWYTASYQQSTDSKSPITLNSRGHVLRAFINGVLVGSEHGFFRNPSFTLNTTVPLYSGVNNISLLSIMVGLPDSGAYLERRAAGLQTVSIQDNQDVKNLTNYSWGYQNMTSFFPANFKLNIDFVYELWQRLDYWERGCSFTQKRDHTVHNGAIITPLLGHLRGIRQSKFGAPGGNDPVALNLASMGKGQVWINGQSIGRYWISFHTSSGSPSQTWYHIPRSFLKPTDNLLVLLEEEMGNPLAISVDTVSITKVCGHVSDSNPPPVISWKSETLSQNQYYKERHGRRPKVQLRCPPRKYISKILFASFGSPSGDCQNYAVGSCHSTNSTAIAEKACMGKKMCSIPWSYKKFGGDPCPGITKGLLVEAQCNDI
ncbi:hypothetical protein BUALT_Bualt08G0117200 [Buddleja alternifolia]|uniref:Beta-galactosidase n=1 Tax=Buddleja alternifolia TaxID=168488 RepID=A0AAV6XCP3_9LAMI|nr:hypothetical protein BUALT_Bualt08G0117200 [Buddleja alternifolia]